jgi:hypothetical protein
VQGGTTIRASVDVSGADPNGTSLSPSISDDGRFVVFQSRASDLVPGDPGGIDTDTDVFVRDTVEGTTTRVSADLFGREANGVSHTSAGGPFISADGRYVTFTSEATNLAPGDTIGQDVFVRAVVTPTIDSVAPATVARRSTTTLTLTGTGFAPDAMVSVQAFGAHGLRETSVEVISPTELKVSVAVGAEAPVGPRTVMVWNPGTGPGEFATGFGVCFHCLTIT